MKRLEEIRSRRPYLAISDDGSGWVSVSDAPKPSDSENGVSDMSPPRKRRARFDTPSPERESKPSSTEIREPNPNSEKTLTPDRNPSPPRREPRSRVESSDYRGKNSGRHDSPDLSPPRRSSSDFGRRNLERPDSPDLSPPRRNRPSTVPLDLERKNSERVESPDLSPPRRSHPSAAASDFRRKNLERNDSPDLSPPRLGRKRSPEFNASHATSGGDLSPPRKNRKDPASVKAGRRAGLISTEEIKEEINKKKKEELLR